MYPEKKSFPLKIVIFVALIILVVLGFIVYRTISEQNKVKAYNDLLTKIVKAGVAYGEKNKIQVQELESECVELTTLIEQKFLTSDSKSEPILYNPKTKEKMRGSVFVQNDESGEIVAEYLMDSPCTVNYSEKIKLVITDKTTRSFVAKIEAPSGLRLSSFEYKIDSEETFSHDSYTYTFDGLSAGNHEVVVKVQDYLGEMYEIKEKIILSELTNPELEYVEETSTVIVKCPDTENKGVKCVYTIDDENWNEIEEETHEVKFEESGKIIAKSTDGYNSTEDIIQEVIVTPKCVDKEWSTCTGCTASCGETCEGIQTSNCENTRQCKLYGPTCPTPTISSRPPVIEYEVIVKASNGEPATQSAKIVAGGKKTFTINPNEGYEYSSIKCSNGKASYSTNTKQLTVVDVKKPITCNVYFTKKVILPTKYSVKFMDFDGELFIEKIVESGKLVQKINAPIVAGYTFVAWTFNGQNFNFNSPITTSIVLNASYRINKVTVSFDTGYGTNISNQYIPIGSLATKPNDPSRLGYKFIGWYRGGLEYDFSKPVTQSINLVAVWASLTIKTVNMPGNLEQVNVNLNNFNTLNNISSTCAGGFEHSIEGSVITLKTNLEESCQIKVVYY